MKLLKRTYALPPETLARFEKEISSGQRSAKIAQLIEEWIETKERENLRREIEEGCKEMWDVYKETAKEWEPLEAEIDRHLDS